MVFVTLSITVAACGNQLGNADYSTTSAAATTTAVDVTSTSASTETAGTISAKWTGGLGHPWMISADIDGILVSDSPATQYHYTWIKLPVTLTYTGDSRSVQGGDYTAMYARGALAVRQEAQGSVDCETLEGLLGGIKAENTAWCVRG